MPWNFKAGSPKITEGEDLELRINIVDAEVTKTLILNSELQIYQICDLIKTNIREAQNKLPKHYGLFLPNEDWRKGLWLHATKTLQHYLIRRGDTLQYKNRIRRLNIRTMDGTRKELKVDDSWTVDELMLKVGAKLGIYNHEEYSLIRTNNQPWDGNDTTFSLKRPLSWSSSEDKMYKLKRKHHTDDDFNWLNPSQSLRQQGISETEYLLVKRRYFFTDMNIDSRDPIQLNLLYEQLKEAVLNGTHPVSLDEAIELGGIQCQIKFGNCSTNTYKRGYIELKEFLPKEYLQSFKNVEKKIFSHYLKLNGVGVEEAKEKYCSTCRSLKTYGITFFLVKEKVKGKNKLLPRLLGINKDYVVQVDEKSKEIVNKWPLTAIKKWAASFSGFTMDFGDYSPDEYYTAQTDKGEKISQLISGYIDITMKRKRARDKLHEDLIEESVIQEETISPLRTIIVAHVPKHGRSSASREDVVLRRPTRTPTSSVRYSSPATESVYSQDADMSQEEFIFSQQASLARTQSPNSSITTNSQYYRMSDDDIKQKMYILSLQDNISIIEACKNQLTVPERHKLDKQEENMKCIDTNVDNSKQRVIFEIGAMNAAVAQVVRSAQGLSVIEESEQEERYDEIVSTMLNSFVVLTISLPHVVDEIKTIVYQQDHLNDHKITDEYLLSAARNLAQALADMIKAAYPIEDRNKTLNRAAIIDAASTVGKVSKDLQQEISGQENYRDEISVSGPVSMIYKTNTAHHYQDELVRLANEVAKATTNLVEEVKCIAVQVDDLDNQKAIVNATTKSAVATSKLILTTQIIIATSKHLLCREQLVYSVEEVRITIQTIVESIEKSSQSNESLVHIDAAVNKANFTIDNLLSLVMGTADKCSVIDNYLMFCETIQRVEVSAENVEELMITSSHLAEATSTMIMYMELKASNSELEPERNDTLTRVAQQLAIARTELIVNTEKFSTTSDDLQTQRIVKETIGRFTVITYSSECSEIIQDEVIDGLLVAATNSAAAGIDLVNISQSAAKKSRSNIYKISTDSTEVSIKISTMLVAINDSHQNPKDHLIRLKLISSCRDYVESSEPFTQSSKYMWPTIADVSLQNVLNQSIKHYIIVIEELKRHIHQAEKVCQHLELSAALELLRRLQEDLNSMTMSIKEDSLIVSPDQQIDEVTTHLIGRVKHSIHVTNELQQELEDQIKKDQQYKSEDKFPIIRYLDSTGKKSMELATALEQVVEATRDVVATFKSECQDILCDTKYLENEIKLQSVHNCLTVIEFAYQLISEAKIDPLDFNQSNKTKHVVAGLLEALARCIDSLPVQRYTDILQQHIEVKKCQFAENKLLIMYDSNTNIQDYQAHLADTVFDFSQAVSELTTAQSFQVISKACIKLKLSYDGLLEGSNTMITAVSSSNDSGNRKIFSNKDDITKCVIIMSNDCLFFLQCYKMSLCDLANIELRDKSQESARILLDSINKLLVASSSSVRRGLKECDNAIVRLKSARPLLDNPVHPVSHNDYYDCLDMIVEKITEPIAVCLNIIPLAVIDDNSQQFIDSVYQCADSVYLLLEDTAQISYLVGIGKVHSKFGYKGMADHSTIWQIQKSISEDCHTMNGTESSSEQKTKAFEDIRENCTKLSDISRSVMVTFPDDKLRLRKKAEVILAAVVSLDSAVNTPDLVNQRSNTEHVLEQIQTNVAGLVALMLSCQFVGDVPYISDEAKIVQGTINSAGIAVLDTAVNVVMSSKDLINQTPGEDEYFIYNRNCKDFTEALNELVGVIKENSPGQGECDELLKLIAKLLRQVQEAKMKIMRNHPLMKLKDRRQEENYHKILQSVLLQIPHCVDDLSKAGKTEPEKMANLLSQLNQLLESMTEGSLGVVAHADLLQNYVTFLEHLVTVLECIEQLLKNLKKSGGNRKATAIHTQIDESAQSTKEACNDLLTDLNSIFVENNNIWALIQTIKNSIVKVDESAILPAGAKFFKPQLKMLDICYVMATVTKNIMECASERSSLRLMEPLAYKLTHNYEELCEACQSAVAILNDDTKVHEIQRCVKDVGTSSIAVIRLIFDFKVSVEKLSELVSEKSVDLQKMIEELIRILINSNASTYACTDAIRILKEIKAGIEQFKMNLQYDPDGLENDHYKNSKEPFIKMKSFVLCYSESLVGNIKHIVLNSEPQPDIITDIITKIPSTTKDIVLNIQMFIDDFNEFSPHYNIPLLDALLEVIQREVCFFEELRNLYDLHYNDLKQVTLKHNGKLCIGAITDLLKIFQLMNENILRDYLIIDDAINELEADCTCLSNCISDSTGGSTSRNNTSANRMSIVSDMSLSLNVESREIISLIPSLSKAKDRLLEIIPIDRPTYQKEVIRAALVYCTRANNQLVDICKNILLNPGSNDAKIKISKTSKDIVNNYMLLLKALKDHLNSPSRQTQNEIANCSRQISELIISLKLNAEVLREGPKLIMYFRPSSPEWRDVSEKYIGRHVAYHHCYVKSFSEQSSHSLQHVNEALLNSYINSRNPSDVDVRNAKKLIKYIIEKLRQFKPNAKLIGIDKLTVANVDQILSTIIDMGIYAENLTVITYKLCRKLDKAVLDKESKTIVYQSVIAVVSSMKDLVEAVQTALTSEVQLSISDNLMSVVAKKVINSTSQFLFDIQPLIHTNKQLAKCILNYGKAIKSGADFILNVDGRHFETVGRIICEEENCSAKTNHNV